MAAGITQPGGAGTTIFFEDNAHADAGGDGSYSWADIAAKFPADFVDNGTFQKSYRGKVTVQNGDGSGTAVTTLRDSSFTVIFDSGKTYQVSVTGGSNRYTEFGTKLSGIKDSGKDLWKLVSGAALSITRNAKLYGGTLQTTTGNVAVAPTLTGLTGEIVNCILQSAGSIALGTAAAPLQEVYNVDMILGNGSLFAVSNIVADSCERVTIALQAGATNQRFINTGAAFAVRDIVFIGTPTIDVIRLSQIVEGTLIEPTYPQDVAVMTGSVPGATLGEWWRFEPVACIEATAALIPGCLIEATRRTGESLVSAVTDSDGRLSYGTGLTANCLKARSLSNVGVSDEAWPLTIILNSDEALGPNYESGRVYLTPWPYKTYLSTQKQLEPLQEGLALRLFVRPGWVEQNVDA